MKLTHFAGSCAIALMVVACAPYKESTSEPESNTANTAVNLQQPNVSGSIFIRQKVALPPDAVLTVTLADSSVADVPSVVIAQQVTHIGDNKPPYHFVLPYDPEKIKPAARILLSAAITINGRLVLVTDEIKQVINRGESNVDLTLVPLPQTEIPLRSGGN